MYYERGKGEEMATVFGQIIRGEVPCDKVFESDKLIAFKDVAPQAPVHILIVPKKELPNLQSTGPEDAELFCDVLSCAKALAERFGIENGYRLVTNNGPLAGQTIHHLHFHLIGGRELSGTLG